jgi:hypothetical protein
LSGVAGVAALGGLTGVPDLRGLTRPHAAHAEQMIADGVRVGGDQGGKKGDEHGGQDPGGKDAQNGKQGKDGRASKDSNSDGDDDNATRVPCDPDQLIAAINLANAEDGGTLKLAEHCTYTLTANQNGNGLPVIVQPITLKGDDTTIVRAANAAAFRILNVGNGGNLTLRDITVKGGQDTTGQGGGGILVQAGGSLAVKDSTITHNTTNTAGGGIANRGTTTVSHSTVSYNSANSDGGGILSAALLRVEDSRLTFNDTAGNGGGLANGNQGTALVEKTTISNNNTPGLGGGIFAVSALTTVHYGTITENKAVNGGGIYSNFGMFTMQHSAVSRNTSRDNGGGIFNNGASFVIENGAVTNNTTSGNGAGIVNTASLVLRKSEVSHNNAVGTDTIAGGILNSSGSVALTETKVTDNSSALPPGGIWSNNPNVTVDAESVIVRNRPTNCQGSPFPIPDCFG